MENHRSKKRLIAASVFVMVWLLSTAYGFWWFQFKDLRPFSVTTSNKNAFFEGERLWGHLAPLLANDKVDTGRDDKGTTVVHFWDPACACSRFNEQHVRQLMAAYRQRGIRFLVLARPGAFRDRAELAQKANKVFGTVEVAWLEDEGLNKNIPSSPAALILDGQRRLAYFGPYSQGAVCSVGTGQFVERILDGVLAGNNPGFINTLAFGCFCDWAKHS